MDTRDKSYYAVAKKGSFDKTHPSFALISKYGRISNRILDVGCGEGTRLSLIENERADKIGVDESKIAISLAKKQYPSIKFIQTEGKLPFPNSSFDFIYSAFVLEHTTNPEKFLKEIVRVLSPGGILLLVAPNFGSPNRASPNNKIPRLIKLISGIKNTLSLLFTSQVEKLNWQQVEPQESYTRIDADTTVEPYLLSLEKFIETLGIKKIESSSLWNLDKGWKFSQFVFKILGSLDILPFSYWGPHLIYVGKKHN